MTSNSRAGVRPNLIRAANMLGLTHLERTGDYNYTGMYGATPVLIYSCSYGAEIYIQAGPKGLGVIIDAAIVVVCNDMYIRTLRLPYL